MWSDDLITLTKHGRTDFRRRVLFVLILIGYIAQPARAKTCSELADQFRIDYGVSDLKNKWTTLKPYSDTPVSNLELTSWAPSVF